MQRAFWTWTAIIFAAGLIMATGAMAEEKAEHGFIGVKACGMCHKKDATGNQLGKWQEGPHAKAYETLGTDAAKAAAAELGLEGDPQTLDECLSCHVTAHGAKAELIGKRFMVEDGVGCESCHGAGADYKSKKVMEDRAAAVAAGMIVPTEETCTACHNEKSPTFKGFDYAEYLAKVAHPNPAKAGK